MLDLALHELHQSLGAKFTQVNGLTAADHYGDPLAEHAALKSSAGVLDLSFRGRLCLTGADRQRFLNGQVTNNVKDLKPGQSCYAAIVNHKGKLQGDAFIHALAGELLLDFEPGQIEAVTQRLEKFIIADDVQIINVTTSYGMLSVQGPKAADTLALTGLPLTLPPAELTSVTLQDPGLGEICVVRVPRAGSDGFDLFVPTGALSTVLTRLVAAAAKIGGRLCGWQALEIARIEAGLPRFGVDMDATNLAPEAGIENRAISYTKGCYTGQEVIARIRTYGQVAKSLRGLVLPADTRQLPKKGDKLTREGREVGYVTSAIFSPACQTAVALGYVRKECNQAGTRLVLRLEANEIPVTVTDPPFPAAKA